ncbi:MAG: hypothetical protein ABIH23_18225 [bacterium]
MIAERLESALRIQEFCSEHGACVREDNFLEMYQADGDVEAMAVIRAREPNKAHCQFLTRCPDACRRFPETLGAGDLWSEAGRPCPNNPFAKYALEFERLAADVDLLDEANSYADMVDTGTLPPLEELDPEEFLLAAIMTRRRKRDEVKTLVTAILAPYTQKN